MDNRNARMALKQVKMEIAADYGMDSEDIFDLMENAQSNKVTASHFKNIEQKKALASFINSSNKML